MLYKMLVHTPLGGIRIVCEEDSLIMLVIEGQENYDRELLDSAYETYNHKALSEVRAFIYDYFAERRPDVRRLKLSPEGSDFRLAVWSQLLLIPYGEVISYNDLALRTATALGKKSTSRNAVISAVYENPIPIIIPSHRVVGQTGSLVEFPAGTAKKAQLLRLECQRRTFMPSGIPVLEKRAF